MSIPPVSGNNSFNQLRSSQLVYSEQKPQAPVQTQENAQPQTAQAAGFGGSLKYPPAVIGLINGGCWAMVGFAFDKLCSKMFKYESKTKISMAINSVIGAGMGIYAYIQAKKAVKADNARNT
ncbi:MAG: hypothetical protein LUB59_00915 [Candidatus Gastranaerophilales bacterium]|nr:hypothetical protein [Candidatus Gastranaerophilales bacterium]